MRKNLSAWEQKDRISDWFFEGFVVLILLAPVLIGWGVAIKNRTGSSLLLIIGGVCAVFAFASFEISMRVERSKYKPLK